MQLKSTDLCLSLFIVTFKNFQTMKKRTEVSSPKLGGFFWVFFSCGRQLGLGWPGVPLYEGLNTIMTPCLAAPHIETLSHILVGF